jgi:hypothetical protein
MSIRVLLSIVALFLSVVADSQEQWALVNVSVACNRTTPGHSSELATQSLMGMPVRLEGKNGDFWRVETPDGYIAYVIDNSLALKTDAEMNAWRKSSRLVVVSNQANVYDYRQNSSSRNVVTDLVLGDIVQGSKKSDAERTEVVLPDGRKGWVNASDVISIEDWANQPFDASLILNYAYSLMGVPYLWGGTSTKSMDCSGLVKICYLANGLILRRDASQQAVTGETLDIAGWRDFQSGDLLFFGNPRTLRVNHVAIYDTDGYYIHCSGRVKRNNLDVNNSDYLPLTFLKAVRIHGSEDTDGIVRAKNHPWYFNQDEK